MALNEKSCVPCRGGVAPLGMEEARKLSLEIPKWSLSADAKRLRREFRFADFAEALAFVNGVGALAEQEAHHPEIGFGWGHAEIELWTHKIGGLHENDFILAAKIDGLLPD